jgi:hypothetical protein
MYASFFDELEKIAEAISEPKKSNLKRNLAIGGTLAGALALGIGAAKYRKLRSVAKAAKGSEAAGPSNPFKYWKMNYKKAKYRKMDPQTFDTGGFNTGDFNTGGFGKGGKP